MENKLLNLREFINVITADTNIHICIHDLSGILTVPQFQLDDMNTTHFTDVCNFAKTTQKGLKLCLKFKYLATRKAIDTQKPFKGVCPLGVTEYVFPVVIDKKVMCIIYLGNICKNIDDTKRCMQSVAKITGISSRVTDTISSMDLSNNEERYNYIAEAIQSYIILMYSYADVKIDKQTHWVVKAFANYADTYFDKDITIRELSDIYNINEKYAGRLFKHQMQMTFKEYLNSCRIKKSKKMLRYTDMSIGEIAMYCGYNNITYFNRIFKKSIGLSPREYRKQLHR